MQAADQKSVIPYGSNVYPIPPGYKLSISRKRKPIPPDGIIPENIQAIKGIGYRCPEYCKWVPIRNSKIKHVPDTKPKARKRKKPTPKQKDSEERAAEPNGQCTPTPLNL